MQQAQQTHGQGAGPNFLSVTFIDPSSRPTPRRYNKVADWEPHRAFILRKRNQGTALEDIVTSLKTERGLDVELHQLKHVLRTWKSTVRIKEKQRKYIVAESLRRRAKGKYRTAFKYKDSEEKIPKDKVEKILKRYKTTVNDSENVEDIELMAMTPTASAASVVSKEDDSHDNPELVAVQLAEPILDPIAKSAVGWLCEDSTLTPIEEGMMALSLIGDTPIPDLWKFVDASVPQIRTNHPSPVQEANQAPASTSEPEPEVEQAQVHTPESLPQTYLEAEAEPILKTEIDGKTVDELIELEAQAPSYVELDDAFREFHPVVVSWIARVKRNASNSIRKREAARSNQQFAPEEHPPDLHFTSTESSDELPEAVCLQMAALKDDPDPAPYRGNHMLDLPPWEPISIIYPAAVPGLWVLYASTDAFGRVKLYVDDVARVLFLPTLLMKYGPSHYLVVRALHSFALTLMLICQTVASTEVFDMALNGFERLGMKYHKHSFDALYQVAQLAPFSGGGPKAVRRIQDFVNRCQKIHGPRHPRTISGLTMLARGFLAVGQRELAVKILGEVNMRVRGLLEREKKSKEYADTLRDLGKTEFHAGFTGKAVQTLMEAIQRNDDLQHRPADSSHLSFLLGLMLCQTGRYEPAISFMRRSTMYRSDAFTDLHRATGASMEALSFVWQRRGAVFHDSPMFELLEKLYKHYEKRFGGDHQRTFAASLRYFFAVSQRQLEAAPNMTDWGELRGHVDATELQ